MLSRCTGPPALSSLLLNELLEESEGSDECNAGVIGLLADFPVDSRVVGNLLLFQIVREQMADTLVKLQDADIVAGSHASTELLGSLGWSNRVFFSLQDNRRRCAGPYMEVGRKGPGLRSTPREFLEPC